MRRVPPLVLVLELFATAACSPACAPPEAKAPDGPGPAASPKTKSERDERRQQLAQEEPVAEAKGVDLSGQSDTQRATFFKLINTEPSACGEKPHSLAVSLRDDPDCRDSLIVSQFIADALAAGAPASAIKAEIDGVVTSLTPAQIDITGRPVWGPESAPITVVVFADWECPHCRDEAPVLRKTVDQYRGKAKLVFKHYPLPFHERAVPAGIATEAAHLQGKFWAMHDLVFAHQTELSDENLAEYAQQAGLDMTRYAADIADPKLLKLIKKDRADGEKLGFTGTPAVYVQGRFVDPRLFGGTVAGYIDDALKR